MTPLDSIAKAAAMDEAVSTCGVALERDGFLRRLVRHLSGALQDTVGLEESEGFISLVGQNIGEEINDAYRGALALPHQPGGSEHR